MADERRVVAFQSFKNGILTTYGEGVYMGNLIPDIDPFKSNGISNPCVKLDTGKYVWGFQCWWGDVEEVMKKYGEHIIETITVEPDNIQPLNE